MTLTSHGFLCNGSIKKQLKARLYHFAIMASIKERAAALNLAEKLCVRPQAHGLSSKPVQSSSIWSGIISHLRSAVTVKRRWVNLKSHNDCFLGSQAVDVVAEHVNGVKGLEGASVSRDKVVCVCQALLDCHVFEAVGTKVFGKDPKPDVFQDSKSALYRFVSACTPSVDELERGELVNGIQKLFCAPSDRQNDPTCHGQTSTTVKSTQTSVLADQLDVPATSSLTLGPVVDTLSPSRAKTEAFLPQSVVDEVWHEQTLLRLLNLVELPLLEGLLHCSQSPACPPHSNTHSNPDLIHSSNHLDRQILKAFRDSQKDEWLRAALDCLDFLPDQSVVELSRELSSCFLQDQDTCEQPLAAATSHDVGFLKGQSVGPESSMAHDDGDDGQPRLSQTVLDRYKLLLYESLVKHYSLTDRPPLLPQHMTDVYTAITDLLVNAKLGTALEALQLCLKLLPSACRDELRGLLTFMALAAGPQEIKLDKELENRLTIKKNFSKAILHNKVLQKDKEDLMVVFMLSNIKEIFKIPGALHKGVSNKLASLAEGNQPDLTESMFCQQESSRTYADSTKNATKQELWALLNTIHLDTKISPKERKHLLGQFYQAHPEVFNQYFGETAVNVL